jgi:hypothetical protein
VPSGLFFFVSKFRATQRWLVDTSLLCPKSLNLDQFSLENKGGRPSMIIFDPALEDKLWRTGERQAQMAAKIAM